MGGQRLCFGENMPNLLHLNFNKMMMMMSFTRLAASRWQDSMSRGQKS